MKKAILVWSTVAALGVSGCAQMNETQRTTATGAGIGAVAGAAIGAMTGGSTRSIATGAAIGAALGGAGGYFWSRHMQEQQQAMEQATQGTGVNVSRTADNQLKIEIPSDISFDSGRDDIKPALRPVLDKFAVTLKQNPDSMVKIIGHTDSSGSESANMRLSVNRAAATRNYIVNRGVDGRRVLIEGRGSREPIADNNTAAGRSMNRRVEIFVTESAR